MSNRDELHDHELRLVNVETELALSTVPTVLTILTEQRYGNVRVSMEDTGPGELPATS